MYKIVKQLLNNVIKSWTQFYIQKWDHHAGDELAVYWSTEELRLYGRVPLRINEHFERLRDQSDQAEN